MAPSGTRSSSLAYSRNINSFYDHQLKLSDWSCITMCAHTKTASGWFICCHIFYSESSTRLQLRNNKFCIISTCSLRKFQYTARKLNLDVLNFIVLFVLLFSTAYFHCKTESPFSTSFLQWATMFLSNTAIYLPCWKIPSLLSCNWI